MDDNWKPYVEIDFSDPEAMQFHVDTRDFNVLANKSAPENAPDLTKIKKYPGRFFHTANEIVALLTKYHWGSGGQKEWRYFSLVGMNSWSMKYIRIYRTEHGLLVCNKDNIAPSKKKLGAHTDMQHL